MRKKIILIILLILFLGCIVFLGLPITIKLYKNQKYIFYWIVSSIFLISIYAYDGYKKQKKWKAMFHKQEHILKNIKPQKGIVEDFLVYQEVCYSSKNGPTIKMKFIPVIRNLENGKRYATYGDNSFSACRFYWKQLFTGLLQFSYTDINALEIQIGTPAYLYILEETTFPILKENNLVNIYNHELPYVGSLERIPQNENYKWKANYEKSGIFNINNTIPLFEQDIILFKGLIDYKENPSIEDYKVFAKNGKKKQLYWSIFFSIILFIFWNIWFFLNFT